MTLNEYILQYRLKQAIDKMAESPNSPLSAISDQVGFSDYKYFAKVFKKASPYFPKGIEITRKNSKIGYSSFCREFYSNIVN